MKRLIVLAIVTILCPLALLAEKLPKADRIPSDPTPEQERLILEGIALHDTGKFDEAIARYKRVLDETPTVAGAMYEMAFSYEASGDCESALDVARKGAEYRSELLPRFHMLMGNCLDELGRPDEAVDFYKQAIKKSPDFALLHFNLGVTYFTMGKAEEARKPLQESLYLSPDHGSSHFLLANIHQQLGYKIPAILGISRFLLLEQGTRRTQSALAALNEMMGSNISKGDEEGHINITIPQGSKSKKDEGDFDGLDVALSLTVAATQFAKDDEAKPTPFTRLATTYAVISELLKEPKGKGFTVQYYAPFFAALDEKDFVEAFVYRAFESARVEGAEEWAAVNPEKIADFDQWLTDYRWPAKK